MAHWRTMMDEREYLFACDLPPDRDVVVTIARVTAGKVVGEGGKTNKKPVVYFAGKNKPLALNVSNAKMIEKLYGTFDTSKWIGKRVALYVTQTKFGGETVDCIRIRPTIPRGQDAPADPPSDAPKTDGGTL
jgi:hypothetical protein